MTVLKRFKNIVKMFYNVTGTLPANVVRTLQKEDIKDIHTTLVNNISATFLRGFVLPGPLLCKSASNICKLKGTGKSDRLRKKGSAVHVLSQEETYLRCRVHNTKVVNKAVVSLDTKAESSG